LSAVVRFCRSSTVDTTKTADNSGFLDGRSR
jgi:hypothetical protein